MNEPKLRIIINYEGTHFYTIDDDYKMRQHESLDKDVCLELVLYANKLSNYLKEYCE